MGRLFLFLVMVIVVTILMMIVNVQDQSCQTQQKSAEFQQVTKRDKLIHHTDHLPSVTMTVGAKIRSKPPTVCGMPSELSYTTSADTCQIRIQRIKAPVPRRFFDILFDFSSVLKFCVFFFFPVPPCDDFRLPYREFFHERLLNKPDSQPVNQRTSAKYSAYTTD